MALKEKQQEFALQVEKTWERRPDFLALNPAGDVPVLIHKEKKLVLADSNAICQYLDDTIEGGRLFGTTPESGAETRRLVAWFDQKFQREVTRNLVEEKMMKRFLGLGQPNSQAIRAGHNNITYHLDYITFLMERRNWLAGAEFTLADITAAAHLSCLDYIGDVPWEKYKTVKNWYTKIKCRPSFRTLLADHIPGAPPPKHYADLDF